MVLCHEDSLLIECEVDKEICQQNYADLLLHQDPFIVTCHIFGGGVVVGVGGRGVGG